MALYFKHLYLYVKLLQKWNNLTRYLSALFITLFIYMLIVLLFLSLNFPLETQNITKEKRVKISLKELHTKKIKQPKIEKKIVKKKKIIKKKPLVKKHKKKKKIVKKITPLPKKHTIRKIIQPKPKIIKQKIIQKDPMAWLYEDKSNQEEKQTFTKSKNQNSINQNIKELYGSKFNTLSQSQQEYILDNQEIMRRITQQVLNRVASVNLRGDIHINTSNIVEFYLHPNGDMTDFRFLKTSSYFELDDTTKETIEYAYSKYPRPKEKTLIRYNVFYNLK